MSYKFNQKSTYMSLNDRFTYLRCQPSNNNNNQAVSQASFRNRKLTQQMINRPSVVAALRLKRKSLKQRLGFVKPPQQMTAAPRRGRQRLGGNNSRVGPLPKFTLGKKANLPVPSFRRGGGKFNTRSNAGAISKRPQFRNGGRKIPRGGAKGGATRAGGGFRGGRGGGRFRTGPAPSKQDLDKEIEEYMSKYSLY